MPPLQLADLPEAIPIPYRSAETPDVLDLNSLLIPHPLSTFYMRVRGHRLRNWGVHGLWMPCRRCTEVPAFG